MRNPTYFQFVLFWHLLRNFRELHSKIYDTRKHYMMHSCVAVIYIFFINMLENSLTKILHNENKQDCFHNHSKSNHILAIINHHVENTDVL